MGKKIYHVDLTKEDVLHLEEIVKRRKVDSEIHKRSMMLLAANRGGEKRWKDREIAVEYKVNAITVERLRERFVLHGIELALKGMPRLNEDKIKFDGVVESRLASLRCSNPPAPYSSWTLTLLADELVRLEVVESISGESVRRLLKKTKLSHGESRNG